MRRALTQPTPAILRNAGEESSLIKASGLIVGTLASRYGAPDKFAWDYNASKGEYVDMIKVGIVTIINPLKVVRTALVGAAGVAILLTTHSFHAMCSWSTLHGFPSSV